MAVINNSPDYSTPKGRTIKKMMGGRGVGGTGLGNFSLHDFFCKNFSSFYLCFGVFPTASPSVKESNFHLKNTAKRNTSLDVSSIIISNRKCCFCKS